MATQADARRIALALPATVEGTDRFAFSVRAGAKEKGFIWVWRERLDPKKPRVPNAGVLAVRVASLAEKDMMISAEPAKFFTEPHYNGYPAVLVRLKEVRVAELRELITDAWLCQAPPALVKQHASPGKRATSKTRISRATPMQPPTCPKCSSVMESGFVVDKVGNDSARAPEWAEGVPERSFWTGLNLAGHERHAVVTYRCSACGYLESYAPST